MAPEPAGSPTNGHNAAAEYERLRALLVGPEQSRIDEISDELRSRATETVILGVTVAVCALDDLKAMKRAAGRTRDLADLEDLEAAS